MINNLKTIKLIFCHSAGLHFKYRNCAQYNILIVIRPEHFLVGKIYQLGLVYFPMKIVKKSSILNGVKIASFIRIGIKPDQTIIQVRV